MPLRNEWLLRGTAGSPRHRPLKSHAQGIANVGSRCVGAFRARISLTHSECRLPHFGGSWRTAASDFRHWLLWAPSTHWSKQGRRWKAATEIPQLHSGHSPPQTPGHYLPVGMLLPLQPLNLVLPPYRPLPCYGSQFSQIVGLSSDSRQLGLATHWRVPLSHPRVLLWN